MKFQSKLTGRAIKITLPATATQPQVEALVIEIDIDCPQCGPHTLRLAGHHLRAIRNLTMEFIDLHPDLCGDEAGLAVTNRLQFDGTPPKDPSVN